MGKSIAVVAMLNLALLHVAPVAASFLTPGASASPTPFVSLSVPSISFPLLRVPTIVAADRAMGKPATTPAVQTAAVPASSPRLRHRTSHHRLLPVYTDSHTILPPSRARHGNSTDPFANAPTVETTIGGGVPTLEQAPQPAQPAAPATTADAPPATPADPAPAEAPRKREPGTMQLFSVGTPPPAGGGDSTTVANLPADSNPPADSSGAAAAGGAGASAPQPGTTTAAGGNGASASGSTPGSNSSAASSTPGSQQTGASGTGGSAPVSGSGGSASPAPATITPTAGGMATSTDAKASVTFAAGSVPTDTNVVVTVGSATPPATIVAASPAYDLSAVDVSGARVDHFAAAPQLTIAYDPGSRQDLPSIYYLDPNGGPQRIDSVVDAQHHTVTASLPHFSTYIAAFATSAAVATADLSVTKSGPESAVVGDTLAYVLTVGNAGPDAAHGLAVHDVLSGPGTITLAFWTDVGGGCSWSATVLDCTSSAVLAAGGFAHLNLSVHSSGPGSVTDTASVSASEFDPNSTDNTATATTLVRPLSADLSLTKTGPESAIVGDTLAYVLTISNAGPEAAHGLAVHDVLSGPGTITLAFWTDVGGGCSWSATVLDCTSSAVLAAGAFVHINVGVHADAAGTITDTATASATGSNTADASATTNVAPVPIASAPDLMAADDSGLSNSDNVTNVAAPRFSVHGSPLLRIALLEALFELGSSYADTLGDALIQLTSLLGDGVHSVYAQQYAPNGTPSAPSAALVVTIDTVAPDAPLLDLLATQDTGLSSSDDITNSHVIDLAGSSSEPLWAAQIHSSLTGGVITHLINGASSDWAFHFCPAGCDAFLAEGTRTLDAHLWDVAGNQSAPGLLTVTTDYTAPDAPTVALDPASDSGMSNSDYITNVTAPHIVVTGEAGASQAISLNGTLYTGTPLADGVYSITATLTDLAGNTSAAGAAPLQLMIDTSGPTGDFTPAGITINSQLATSTPNESVVLNFSDNSAPAEVAFSTDGGATYSAFTAYLPHMVVLLSHGDGLYSIVAIVRDLAGNASTPVSHAVRLDTTGPAVTITSPGTSVDVGTMVTFRYTASDVDNVATQSATLDGAAIANGSSIDTDTLAAGLGHTIIVTATDGLGNRTTVTLIFQVHATIGGLKNAVVDGVRRGQIAIQMQTPLLAKLTAAGSAIAAANYPLARSSLQDFINLVSAQTGKKIDRAYATLLIGWAQDLIARLP